MNTQTAATPPTRRCTCSTSATPYRVTPPDSDESRIERLCRLCAWQVEHVLSGYTIEVLS